MQIYLGREVTHFAVFAVDCADPQQIENSARVRDAVLPPSLSGRETDSYHRRPGLPTPWLVPPCDAAFLPATHLQHEQQPSIYVPRDLQWCRCGRRKTGQPRAS